MNPIFLVAGALLVAFPRALYWLVIAWAARWLWIWTND
jgi:hypothetical protein